MPKFTCSLNTRWVFLLGKPGKAALCSRPGSPASPLKTKSPQPCANISGGDKERADHTVGARYVRRTAQNTLTRTSPTIPWGPFKLQYCFPYWAPHENSVKHVGRYHSALQLEKLSTLSHCPRSTLQPRFPYFFKVLFLNPCPEKALKRPRSLYLVVWPVSDLGTVGW